MSVRTKRTCLVLAAQMACVGVGLWMHHRFATSSATKSIQAQIWAEMEEDAQTLFGDLSDSERRGKDADTISQTLDRRRRQQAHNPGDVTLVDHHSHILASTYIPHDTGKQVRTREAQWVPALAQSEATGRILRGEAVLYGVTHAAVRYDFDGQNGYGLLHVPLEQLEARTAILLSALPAISVLTFAWTCVLSGFAIYMILARLYDEIDEHRSRSAAETLRQTHDLVRTRDAVIFGLAKLADSRDPETGDHLERISVYSTTLASALRRHPKFGKEITPGFVRLIGISAALHDIGKVGVEDRILRKPGRLTSGERATMQTHSMIGGKCLQEIEQRLGGSNFLQMAREIAFTHHENWDGTGYPNGLVGTHIPLSGRIVAIADVYDALSSKRVYKEAIGHDECVEIIRSGAGKKFDPELIHVWLTIESKFHLISRQYGDRSGRSTPEAHEVFDLLDSDVLSQDEPRIVMSGLKCDDNETAPIGYS